MRQGGSDRRAEVTLWLRPEAPEEQPRKMLRKGSLGRRVSAQALGREKAGPRWATTSVVCEEAERQGLICRAAVRGL